ncbi:MAG: site-2 protease family protein [Dehalobacterium sp.]|jgi:stage IV sporulation protein FB
MMGIGQVFGIRIRVSKFLPLLFIICFILGIGTQAVLVFLILTAHEFGHVMVARYWGIKIRTIELHPLGGVARIENLYSGSLKKEITLALAGPGVNFLLAGLFGLFLYFDLGPEKTWLFLCQATLIIGCFNLIPIWPFDGGRILRGVLSSLISYYSTTKLIFFLGQIGAAFFFIYGAWALSQNWANFHWWIIAAYLFIINKQEQKMALLGFMSYLAQKEKEIKEDGFLPGVILVAYPQVPLKKIILRMVPFQYHLVFVLNYQGQLLGMITEKTLINMVFQGFGDITLGEVLGKKGS